MFTVIASQRAQHQLSHQRALCEGLAAHGIETKTSFSENSVDTQKVACWGWRRGKILRERGHDVLIMERGYIGDRFHYTSLAWNGLNGHATFPDYPVDNGERFALHGGVLKPWNKGGEYALILGQVPGDASLKGRDLVPWYSEMAIQIQQLTGLGVLFRPHPDLKKKGMVQNVRNTSPSTGTLQEALEGAAFSVCFNSNAAVDSILAGVPCVAGDKGTMAWDMCSPSIIDIRRPEREAWAHKLAFTQWSMEEIRSGEALHGIVK